jgi:tetratricopeptide (TPR) repeat protein
MSLPVTVTFMLADWIAKGLKDGTFERVGGVIREVGSKKVVTWLREVSPTLIQSSTILSQFGSAASILNLGVSVIGFALVINRLEEIEQRLKLVEKDLKQLNRKFDISVYANFRAALDLARDAFTMTKPENRVNMANLAINRFLEAQHTYVGYLEIALEENIQVADEDISSLLTSVIRPRCYVAEEYLSSLFLTYVARARCYLELEEIETARRCLQEGAEVLPPYVGRFSGHVMVSNQKSYEQAQYKMMGAMFQEGFRQTYLPFWPPSNDTLEFGAKGFIGIIQQPERKRAAMEKAMSMWENYRRFESYQTELQAISQLGISFHNWLKLTPSTEIKPDGAELIYIIPSKPLELQPSI